ncbi:MAG: hypothetical protein ACXWER_05730 [Halobacteriota archaeon]
MADFLKSFLVNTFGWPAPLFHSDTAVLDRWLWMRKRLPRGDGTQQAIELGCGTDLFAGMLVHPYTKENVQMFLRDAEKSNAAIQEAVAGARRS